MSAVREPAAEAAQQVPDNEAEAAQEVPRNGAEAGRGYVSRVGGRVRFRDLLRAEWVKYWSLRSTYAVLGVGAAVAVGINVNSARSNEELLSRPNTPAPGLPERPVDKQFLFDPLSTAFTSPAWQILMVVAAGLGAMALTGEHGSGLIRTTFAAVPARRAVAAAKGAVVVAVTSVLGAVVAGVSFGVTQAVLREHGGLSITDPGAFRAVAASALLIPVCALIGLATGALVRHSAGSVGAVVGLLVLAPGLFNGETYRWVREIGNVMPVNAWQKLIQNPERHYGTPKYPVTETEAWVALGAWALVAAVLVLWVVERRDV
ncbi:ABC transporter permease [Streptomyces sp. NPDC020875]|uniref:ABC transporter permease n=1 Tax=Streptomyces sp. NPDC020875 TaxID=3154898 RepID=UPI0033C5DAE9